MPENRDKKFRKIAKIALSDILFFRTSNFLTRVWMLQKILAWNFFCIPVYILFYFYYGFYLYVSSNILFIKSPPLRNRYSNEKNQTLKGQKLKI